MEQKTSLLRIGKIPYANLFPIFYTLERECECSNYEFIEGVPSNLNRMLRDGEIDISPSSSIEYLRHQDRYTIINGHSISSKGHIGSILLFSRRPIETLNGLTVLVSSQSETSTALLNIILKKFYGIECPLRPTGEPIEKAIKSHSAYLLIGDDALKAERAVTSMHIYDLGEIWHKNTGLPFVFALWIARKDCCTEKTELFEKFTSDLNKSKKLALKNLTEIASASPLKVVLSEDDLVSYWKRVSYDFGDGHKKGIELFTKYSEELGLITK